MLEVPAQNPTQKLHVTFFRIGKRHMLQPLEAIRQALSPIDSIGLFSYERTNNVPAPFSQSRPLHCQPAVLAPHLPDLGNRREMLKSSPAPGWGEG
jgi:hypothetical protein